MPTTAAYASRSEATLLTLPPRVSSPAPASPTTPTSPLSPRSITRTLTSPTPAITLSRLHHSDKDSLDFWAHLYSSHTHIHTRQDQPQESCPHHDQRPASVRRPGSVSAQQRPGPVKVWQVLTKTDSSSSSSSRPHFERLPIKVSQGHSSSSSSSSSTQDSAVISPLLDMPFSIVFFFTVEASSSPMTLWYLESAFTRSRTVHEHMELMGTFAANDPQDSRSFYIYETHTLSLDQHRQRQQQWHPYPYQHQQDLDDETTMLDFHVQSPTGAIFAEFSYTFVQSQQQQEHASHQYPHQQQQHPQDEYLQQPPSVRLTATATTAAVAAASLPSRDRVGAILTSSRSAPSFAPWLSPEHDSLLEPHRKEGGPSAEMEGSGYGFSNGHVYGHQSVDLGRLRIKENGAIMAPSLRSILGSDNSNDINDNSILTSNNNSSSISSDHDSPSAAATNSFATNISNTDTHTTANSTSSTFKYSNYSGDNFYAHGTLSMLPPSSAPSTSSTSSAIAHSSAIVPGVPSTATIAARHRAKHMSLPPNPRPTPTPTTPTSPDPYLSSQQDSLKRSASKSRLRLEARLPTRALSRRRDTHASSTVAESSASKNQHSPPVRRRSLPSVGNGGDDLLGDDFGDESWEHAGVEDDALSQDIHAEEPDAGEHLMQATSEFFSKMGYWLYNSKVVQYIARDDRSRTKTIFPTEEIWLLGVRYTFQANLQMNKTDALLGQHRRHHASAVQLHLSSSNSRPSSPLGSMNGSRSTPGLKSAPGKQRHSPGSHHGAYFSSPLVPSAPQSHDSDIETSSTVSTYVSARDHLRSTSPLGHVHGHHPVSKKSKDERRLEKQQEKELAKAHKLARARSKELEKERERALEQEKKKEKARMKEQGKLEKRSSQGFSIRRNSSKENKLHREIERHLEEMQLQQNWVLTTDDDLATEGPLSLEKEHPKRPEKTRSGDSFDFTILEASPVEETFSKSVQAQIQNQPPASNSSFGYGPLFPPTEPTSSVTSLQPRPQPHHSVSLPSSPRHQLQHSATFTEGANTSKATSTTGTSGKRPSVITRLSHIHVSQPSWLSKTHSSDALLGPALQIKGSNQEGGEGEQLKGANSSDLLQPPTSPKKTRRRMTISGLFSRDSQDDTKGKGGSSSTALAVGPVSSSSNSLLAFKSLVQSSRSFSRSTLATPTSLLEQQRLQDLISQEHSAENASVDPRSDKKEKKKSKKDRDSLSMSSLTSMGKDGKKKGMSGVKGVLHWFDKELSMGSIPGGSSPPSSTQHQLQQSSLVSSPPHDRTYFVASTDEPVPMIPRVMSESPSPTEDGRRMALPMRTEEPTSQEEGLVLLQPKARKPTPSIMAASPLHSPTSPKSILKTSAPKSTLVGTAMDKDDFEAVENDDDDEDDVAMSLEYPTPTNITLPVLPNPVSSDPRDGWTILESDVTPTPGERVIGPLPDFSGSVAWDSVAQQPEQNGRSRESVQAPFQDAGALEEKPTRERERKRKTARSMVVAKEEPAVAQQEQFEGTLATVASTTAPESSKPKAAALFQNKLFEASQGMKRTTSPVQEDTLGSASSGPGSTSSPPQSPKSPRPRSLKALRKSSLPSLVISSHLRSFSTSGDRTKEGVEGKGHPSSASSPSLLSPTALSRSWKALSSSSRSISSHISIPVASSLNPVSSSFPRNRASTMSAAAAAASTAAGVISSEGTGQEDGMDPHVNGEGGEEGTAIPPSVMASLALFRPDVLNISTVSPSLQPQHQHHPLLHSKSHGRHRNKGSIGAANASTATLVPSSPATSAEVTEGSNTVVTVAPTPTLSAVSTATPPASGSMTLSTSVVLDENQKELVAFLMDFQSRFWFTYRKDMQRIEPSFYTCDSGWGCMMRTGQCLLAQAFVQVSLGREWRAHHVQTDKSRAQYKQVLEWFVDEPERYYSIHGIAKSGLALDKRIGDWFGPSTVAHALKRLSQRHVDCPVTIMVPMDGTVCVSEIIVRATGQSAAAAPGGSMSTGSTAGDKVDGKEAHKKEAEIMEEKWKPVVVLLPTRFGLDRLTARYVPNLKQLFRMPQFLGIAGGRPGRSLYFVASQGNELYYLDPHFVKPRATAEDVAQFPVASYHCHVVRAMDIMELDPSMLLGFLIRSRADLCDLLERLKGKDMDKSYPLITVVDDLNLVMPSPLATPPAPTLAPIVVSGSGSVATSISAPGLSPQPNSLDSSLGSTHALPSLASSSSPTSSSSSSSSSPSTFFSSAALSTTLPANASSSQPLISSPPYAAITSSPLANYSSTCSSLDY